MKYLDRAVQRKFSRENAVWSKQTYTISEGDVMKNILYFILITLFSCHSQRKQDEQLPFQPEENSWTVYEGRVSLSDKTSLYIELSLLPATQEGDGSYQLSEFIEEDYIHTSSTAFKGKYSTLYGEDPEERIVQFHNSAYQEPLKRIYVAPAFKGQVSGSNLKMIREESFRNMDLAVKTQGKNKLIVLDKDLKPVTSDPEQNLTRRSSKLFTMEGYFRHNGDTAEFFEMNTREQWAVSKLGNYHQAINQYHKLTKEKFEVTYLKAIGFSIQHTDQDGKEIEGLVIKRILQMTSSPTLTEEYNRRGQ